MSLPSLPYYHIDRLIAEGGTARVYWGIDMRSGFPVAIKELKFNYMKYDDIVQLFKGEANKYLYFTHPFMTKLIDFYDYKGRLYIMMEYVEGMTLDAHISTVSGPIPEEAAVPMFNKILDVIDFLHNVEYPDTKGFIRKGVLHLDIKSNNIMVLPDKNSIKLLDLGISVNVGEGAFSTGFGTPNYMPPEQGIKGAKLGRYTDIFSLGVLLFEMLTGRLPFWSKSREETRRKITFDPTPQAQQFYPPINPEFQIILERATAKNPMDRYQTCKEMKDALLMIKNK